ncbi:hypothetical protein [Pseudophaeobacter sp.]|uniref:hypothetical protein n=1 Tax=Pseudophaeobacter sp. TaxID=1971739 RepID=UPI003297CC45
MAGESMQRFRNMITRKALDGKIPFSDQILKWETRRFMNAAEPSSSLRYELKIPDSTRPFGPEIATGLGPKHELIPLVPVPLTLDILAGKPVEEISTELGSYGMGGEGFFGLRLGQDWFVIALSGAAAWLRFDGVLIEGWFCEEHGRPKPWIDDEGDRLSPQILGAQIVRLDVQPHSLHLGFDNGSELSLDATLDLPVFEGRKAPRRFLEEDDLNHALFLAPTREIWVL